MAMHGYARRLLQESAAYSPSDAAQRSASVVDNTTTPSRSDPANIEVNSHFSPSMVVVLVIFVSTFFFMAFFAVYVRGCASDDDFLPRTGNSVRRGRRDGLAAQQGVDPALVGSFPLVSYAAVKKKGCNECIVCLTDFEGSENLRQLPKCKHVFHPGCIDMWLESHTTCPLCRRSLVNSDRWSVSLRWGSSRGSSVSAHLNEDGSVRSRGGESQTPRGGEGEVSPRAAHDAGCIFSELADREVTGTPSTPRDNIEPLQLPPPPPQGWRRLRRSNSTGHSLLKGTLTRAAFLAPADDGSGTPASESRLSLSPLRLHRSRSVRLDGGEGQQQVASAASSQESPSAAAGGCGGAGGGGGWSSSGGGGGGGPSGGGGGGPP